MLAALAVLAPLLAAAGDDGPPPCAFAGRVVTPAGEPAGEAVVSLLGAGEERFEAVAGPDGRFALAGLPTEAIVRRYLNAHAHGGFVAVPAGWAGEAADTSGGAGLAPGVLPVPAPAPGRTVEVGDVPLAPGTVFRGRIVGPGGQPAAGAGVAVACRLRYQGTTINRLLPTLAVAADAGGRFVTPPLPPCEVELLVSAPGCRDRSVLRSPDGTAAVVRLRPVRLPAESPVVLEVADAGGEPVAGAEVRSFPGYAPLSTDAAGRVRLPGLGPDGPRQTQVRADGFRYFNGEPAEERDPAADGSRAFRLVLERSRRLSFGVTDAATGGPVEVESVVLCEYERDDAGNPRLVGCTNPAVERVGPGEFAVAHYGALPYHLEIRAPGYEPSDIFLDPLPSDADHEVGPFTLTPAGGTDAAADAAAGNSPTVTVRGTVVATGGADPAGALVTAWFESRPIRGPTNAAVTFGRLVPNPPRCVGVTVADADGRFSLEITRTGRTYLVRADAAPAGAGETLDAAHRPAFASARVDVPAGAEPGPATLSPAAGGDIAGGGDGWPLVRGPRWAVAFDAAGWSAAAPTAADGSFRLRNLPPGEWGVKVGRLGGADPEAGHERPGDADPWRRAERVTPEPDAVAASGATLPPW